MSSHDSTARITATARIVEPAFPDIRASVRESGTRKRFEVWPVVFVRILAGSGKQSRHLWSDIIHVPGHAWGPIRMDASSGVAGFEQAVPAGDINGCIRAMSCESNSVDTSWTG